MPRRKLRKEESNRVVSDFQERQGLLSETTRTPPTPFSSLKAADPLIRPTVPSWEGITLRSSKGQIPALVQPRMELCPHHGAVLETATESPAPAPASLLYSHVLCKT